MFAVLRAKLGGVFKTKVGLALIGALVIGGGGTAMAMATTHGQLFSNLVAVSPTGHSDDKSDATKAGHDDQDDKDCTGSTTGATASPTAHSDDESSATKVAGKDDQEANENENAQADQQEDQNETECKDSSPEGTRTPEPTERPEGTHTPGPSPTSGPGGE